MRSVLPSVPGVPWWGAVLVAVGFTALGALIDLSLNASLGLIYNLLFVLGCVVAALAVRRRALFTAAVQPPLVTLGVGMASLYFATLARSGSGRPQGMRRMVLNIALPFSNLFPWILTAFVLTLAVVAFRYYSTRAVAAAEARRGGSDGRHDSAGIRRPVPAGAKRSNGAAGRPGDETAHPDRKPVRPEAGDTRPGEEPRRKNGKAARPAPATDSAEHAPAAPRKRRKRSSAPGEPPAQKPAAQNPTAQNPAAQDSAAQRPPVQNSADQNPAAQNPAAQQQPTHPAPADPGAPAAPRTAPPTRPAAAEAPRTAAPSRPSAPAPAPEPQAAPQQQVPPRTAPVDEPRYVERSTPIPVGDLPPIEVTGPATTALPASTPPSNTSSAKNTPPANTPPGSPARRAQPQVIPPRKPGDRPRRTAREELRQKISIEDFLADPE